MKRLTKKLLESKTGLPPLPSGPNIVGPVAPSKDLLRFWEDIDWDEEAEMTESTLWSFQTEGAFLLYSQSGEFINVIGIYTDPPYRRQGKARALIEAFQEHAAQHRCKIWWGGFSEDGSTLKLLLDPSLFHGAGISH